MSLRDNCRFPDGVSAEAVKHYQEVLDAIEQIYPDAKQFCILVQGDTGRIYWDFSESLAALGLVELYKASQFGVMSGMLRAGPSKGDTP